MEVDFGAAKGIDALNAEFIEGLLRGGGLADGAAEGGEVVVAQEAVGAFLHGGFIEVVFDLPDKASLMRGGRATHQQTEEIAAFKGREARVPIVVHPRAGGDGDGGGFELEVECF